MTWLVVSDLHYALRQYDWVASVAPDFDVVVIAGDLLDIRSAVPIEAQKVAVAAQVARIGDRGTVVIASGNHDLDGRDSAGEKAARWLQTTRASAVHVDGDSVDVGATRFRPCPWWDGPNGRDELEKQLVDESRSVPGDWAWVYHAPPAGSPLSWDGRREFGDEVLGGWIEKLRPRFVFTGHIHQAPFTDAGGWYDRVADTWLFNPGRQPGPVPAHIVIEPATGDCTWYSIEGRESVNLDSITQR
jgi:Icc-related predicted phosphoesterase